MGKRYISYRLVASYRNEQGKVRQTMILNLGAGFCIDKKEWKLLTDRVEQILLNKPSCLLNRNLSNDTEAASQRIVRQIRRKQKLTQQ